MGMTRAEIELLINARNNAQSAFDQLSGQVEKVTGAAGTANTTLKDTGDQVERIGIKGIAAGVALGEFAEKMAHGLFDIARETVTVAARTEGLGAVAEFLGQKAGYTKEQIDGLIQSLNKQGISIQDSENVIIQLSRANIDLSYATKLATAAQNGAFIAGINSSQALTLITDGIQKLSPELLRSAGYIVSLEQAEQEWHKETGKAVASLTEHQKQQLLLNKVLDQAQAIQGTYALSMQFVGKQLTSLPRYFEDAQAAIGKQFLPELRVAVEGMTDFLKVAREYPQTFAGAITAVVALGAPLAIVKAEAALGLPSVTALAFAWGSQGFLGAIRDVPATLGNTRTALQLAGETAGITAAKLGALGTGVSLLSAAFIGWQIGKAIDGLTGLSSAAERAYYEIQRLAGGIGNDWAMMAQTSAAKQDVINKAIKQGADATVTYAQAIDYNNKIEAVRIAQFDKSAGAQLRRIDAEQALGRITIDNANAQRLAIENEQHLADIRAKRMTFTAVIAASEKQFRDEITATGMSEAELLRMMKKDEVGFETWAKKVDLSQETVKRLKTELTAQNKEAEKAVEQEKRLQKATDDIIAAGQGWQGTLAKINPSLRELAEGLLRAGVTGEDLKVKYGLTDAQVKALTKDISAQDEATRKMTEANDKFQAALDDVATVGVNWKDTLAQMNQEQVGAIEHDLQAGAAMSSLKIIYGLTETQVRALQKAIAALTQQQTDTDRSINQTKDLWNEYYALIADKSGSTTAKQIAEVEKWRQHEIDNLKADDQNWTKHYDAIQALAEEKVAAITRANDPLWQAWKGLTSDMRGAWADTWDKALAGEVSFASAALQPFKDLQTGLRKIFAAILADFEAQLLAPLLGLAHNGIAMLLNSLGMGGGGGAFGGGGATALGGGVLAKLFGGGGRAAGGAGASGAAGAGGLFGMGGLSVGALGTLLNIGLAGGAGAGLGFLGHTLFGGGGVKAGMLGGIGGGVLGGLAFGGPVGAIAGGLAGLVTGLLGMNSGRNSVTDFAKGQGGFEGLQKQLAEVTKAGIADGNALWVALTQGTPRNNKDVAVRNIQAVQDALAKLADYQQRVNASADALGLTWEDMGQAVQQSKITEYFNAMLQQETDLEKAGYNHDAILKKQADGYSQLLQKAKDFNATIPAGLKPVLQELIDLGLLVDAAGNKVTELGDIFTQAGADAADAANRAGNAWSHVTPRGDDFQNTQPDGRGPEGAAAGGVMATRPGLVLFGEGGEPEVGGPASFFQSIFNKLGVGGGQQGGPLHFHLNVDGRTFAEIVVPWIPQVVGDHGLVPST